MDQSYLPNEQKSRDWKYDSKKLLQKIAKLTDKKSTQKATINTEIKSRNPYSISNSNNQIQFSNKTGMEMTGTFNTFIYELYIRFIFLSVI